MNNTTKNQSPKTEITTYRVGVPVVYYWPTGNIRGTGVRYFDIEETSSVMGGVKAIDAAIANVGNWHDEYSPTIEPNPAKLGWPIGEF